MARAKSFDENEVLNKAMNLFWKQGYAATSIQDLVAHLGINRASLYTTFGDKEQLFGQSFRLYQQTNLERLTQFFGCHPSVKEGFSGLFHQAIEEALSDKDKKGCFVVNTTTELIPNDEAFLDILAENKRMFVELFHDYLKKGQQDGQLPAGRDLKPLATLLYTLYNGIRVVSKVKPDKQQLTSSIEIALSLLD